MTARSSERLEAAAAGLRAAGGEVITVPADLRDPTAASTLATAAAALGPIDLVVNNAGTAPSAKLARTTDDMLAEVLDLHVAAPFRLLREVLPGMVERGGGCAIQLASTAGLRGFPFVSAYVAAKHGMVGLTRALAVELGSTPVRVYAVCPGFVETDITREAAAAAADRSKRGIDEMLAGFGAMNACGRLIQPREVADAVAHLAAGAGEIASGSLYVLDEMPPVVQES